MSTPRALRQPLSLKLTSNAFLIFWCLIAAFPIFWILVMSFKQPIDAFAANPLNVIFGPETRAEGKGLSVIDIVFGIVIAWFSFRFSKYKLPNLVHKFSPTQYLWFGWVVGIVIFMIAIIIIVFGILPTVLNILNNVCLDHLVNRLLGQLCNTTMRSGSIISFIGILLIR